MGNILSELGNFSTTNTIDDYLEKYAKKYPEVLEFIYSPNKLTSTITSSNIEKALSRLKFSVIFNDVSIFSYNKDQHSAPKISVLNDDYKNYLDNSEGLRVHGDTDAFDSLIINDNTPVDFDAGFWLADDSNLKLAIDELEPFLSSGDILLQPNRSLFANYFFGEGGSGFDEIKTLVQRASDDKTSWLGLMGSHNLNPDHGDKDGKIPLGEDVILRLTAPVPTAQYTNPADWHMTGGVFNIEEPLGSPEQIIYEQTDHLNHENIFDVCIPYIEGIQFADLKKLIDDEHDSISNLRRGLAEASVNHSSAQELLKDLVQPEVELLNRKFKALVNTHSFKVAGATVGTMALAYTAITTAGAAGAVAAMLGSGGAGLLGKEYADYYSKRSALKENPYYFLWRCNRVS